MFNSEQNLSVPNVDLLSWTFAHVNDCSDKPIFVNAHEPSERLLYRDIKNNVRKVISGLRSNGVERGDSVCVLSFNDIFYSILYLGIIGAGACFVGANPAYKHLELRHLLSIARTKLLVVDPDLLDSVLPAAAECGISQSSIFTFDSRSRGSRSGFRSWRTLFEHGEQDWISFHDEFEAKSTTACLMLTSGTTGLPKAAKISHYAQVAQSVMLYDSKDKHHEVTRLLSLPQFHSFIATLAHIAPIREGHTTYIMKRHQSEDFLQYINLYQITETATVPPIVLGLLALPSSEQKLLCTLRYVWCAGAPLSADTHRRILQVLDPRAIFSQVWGLTEAGWITTFHFPERDHTGSVGRLLPNMEAKIVGTDGEDIVADKQHGEILVRGPSVMSGYLSNIDATKSSFANGWLRTGDIGYCDRGKWYITDRAKELIKVRGWQVSPTELETCLLGHPSIVDAAIIGVEVSETSGELPRAYVVLNPLSYGKINETVIQEYVRERLAKYKALEAGVKFVPSIPRSVSGKILRRQLKEVALEELKTEKRLTQCENGDRNGENKPVA